MSDPDPPLRVCSLKPLQGSVIPRDKDRGFVCASQASQGSQGDPHLLLPGSEARGKTRTGSLGNSAHVA